MTEGVLISIISFIGVSITALITAYYTIKVKRLELSNTISTKQVAKLRAELTCINVLFEYNLIALINRTVDDIFKNTKAERFIILFALNGKTDFNFVSVCYEKTKSSKTSGAIYRYVRVQIDDHYRQMLKYVEKDHQVYIDVANMQECLLKNIYQSIAEGVTFSGVHFINRSPLDEDNDTLVYCSMATTDPEDFTKQERSVMKLAMDNIRSHAKEIDFKIKYKQHQ